MRRGGNIKHVELDILQARIPYAPWYDSTVIVTNYYYKSKRPRPGRGMQNIGWISLKIRYRVNQMSPCRSGIRIRYCYSYLVFCGIWKGRHSCVLGRVMVHVDLALSTSHLAGWRVPHARQLDQINNTLSTSARLSPMLLCLSCFLL